MSWDKIENHLFYRYDVEGEDKELSDLTEEHDKEVGAKAIDEFADRLSKYLNVESATKYGNKDAEQQRNSYDTLMKYEIADAIDDIAEQMKTGGENEND